ncbi:mucin-2-like [Corapipo altera]|uniref:mucin-2-like n=1 Tax=Corapipo altera TaxID=415028 RepID=UPI000FD62F52|nr:mucin-2-like [Corapipo altera]
MVWAAPAPAAIALCLRCLSEPITATTIAMNPLLFLDYSPEEFNLCLSNDVLIENLEALLDIPFTVEYYKVMKEKVDQTYPSGIPEEQLRRLGLLARQYSEEEISQWSVTSSDTLAALLDPSGGEWDDSQVQQLLSRYLTLGGTLTGPLLQAIGGSRLCNLREVQMEQIPAQAIGTAGQLNISACSQAKKELLYRKAREAFAGLADTPSAYYCRLRPYLGGAPADDLKDLANAGVAIDMDMDTFLSLNPEELQKLSVMDVKNLLGKNLPELKKAENEPLVMGWVERQFQRELDRVLGIGLQGGMEDPTGTTTPAAPTTASPTPVATTTPLTTQSSTVPLQTPTPSALSPTPLNNSPPSTESPPTTPTATSTATPTAHPTLTTTSIAPPCSTHQFPTTNKATPSPVPLLPTTLAPVNPNTTSPSSVPVPAVTSRATTSTSVGTDPAGTTHSTSSPLVPVNTPAPGGTTHPAPATHSTVIPGTHSAASTPVPNPTSAPTATPVPNPTSAPTATHSTVIPSTHSTATPVPNPTSAATATHTTITLSTPSAPSTPVPNPTSFPTAIHSTAPPVPHSPSAPTATHSTARPVPLSTSAPTAPGTSPPPHKPTPIPSSTISTQKSIISSTPETTTVPCPTSAPPGFPSPSSTTTRSEATKPTPGAVPESPRPTSNGHINLQPKPDSGPRLSSCLIHVLAVTMGTLLLQGLL